jgi:hypothetical protein
MNTEPLRSLLKPSTRSSGIKEPANERPHQPSETLHGFGGSPGPDRERRGGARSSRRSASLAATTQKALSEKAPILELPR